MKQSLDDDVRVLMARRRFSQALDRLTALTALEAGEAGGDLRRLAAMRHCLARLGRFDEAARVGALVAARDDDPLESARLARLWLDAGDVEAAAAAAVRAVALTPPASRGAALGPLMECLLLAPETWSRVERDLRPLGVALDVPASGAPAPPAKVREPTLHVPLAFPQYRGLDHDHPAHMRLIAGVNTVKVTAPDEGEWRGLAGFPRAAEIARRRFDRLAAGRGPLVRAWAARFVAARLPATLHTAPPGALDFIMAEPLTLGAGDWVYWHDQLISAFQPSRMFETTRVSPRRAPDWWFLRDLLSDRRCRAVFSHFRRTREDMTGLMRLPALAGKIHHVRAYDNGAEIAGTAIARDLDGPLRILFTSSRAQKPGIFFYRGGVDALAVFRRYREKGGSGRLFMRSPMPDHLDAGWLKRVLGDDVTILDGPLSHQAFADLRGSCHAALLPAALVFRASLVEFAAAGLPTLAYRIPGVEEFVKDGVTGMLAERRAEPFALDPGRARLSFDATPLFAATAGPMDVEAVERLADHLLCLDRDRDLLARMCAANRAGAGETAHGAEDQAVFNRQIAAAAEAAFHDAGD